MRRAARELGKPLQHGGLVYSATFQPQQRTQGCDSVFGLQRARLGRGHGTPGCSAPLLHDDRVPSARVEFTRETDHFHLQPTTRRGVWDVEGDGAPIGNPETHLGPVHGAALSTNSQFVLTASDDRTGQNPPDPPRRPEYLCDRMQDGG